MTFDEWLNSCIEDTVDEGSGDWPANAPRPGEVVSAHYRSRDWRDVNTPASEQDYDFDFSKGICIHCGERKRLDDDGWCADCDRGDPAYEAELVKRANEEAAKRGHAQTADLLRRIAADEKLDATFRSVLLEQAEWHAEKK